MTITADLGGARRHRHRGVERAGPTLLQRPVGRRGWVVATARRIDRLEHLVADGAALPVPSNAT